jgi:replication factor A1
MKIDYYIKKIIEETGLSKNEINNRVEEKKKELKGLISDEGALFIIAKELGVNIEDQNRELLEDIELNISDIKPNMKNIVLVGRIREIYRINTFNRKDGSEGKVGSFLLHDNTGDIRVVLWDDKTEILKNDKFDINELVKIINGYSKENNFSNPEIHIGRLGKIVLSPRDVDYKKHPKISQKPIKIEEVNLSLRSVSLKGKVIRKTPINTFERKDGSQGRVASINLIDSTGSIRITFWNENVNKIKNVEVGATIEATNLNPRQSNLDSTKIELNTNRNTTIKDVKEEAHLSSKMVKNIKSLQDESQIVSFKGVISSVDNLKKVNLKSGDQVSLLSFIVSDETDGIRITLWREDANKYADKLEINQGVLLKNVLPKYSTFSKRTEITFIPSSKLEFIDLDISELKHIDTKRTSKKSVGFSREYSKIEDIDSPGFFEIKGVIVKLFENITVYDACPKCFKKVDNCTCEDPGDPEKRMILNLIIDDGRSTIRTTFIGEQAEKIINKDTEIISQIINTPDYNKFIEELSQNLLGKDLIIRGKAKFSDFSNSYELITYKFKEVKGKEINVELENTIQEIKQL